MLLGVAVMSSYFFPYVLTAFPVANSKMVLAAIGIVIYAVRIFKRQDDRGVDRAFVNLSLWALAVSLTAWIATVVNNTHDYTFATYIVSMWVWIGGAYVAVNYIRAVHGKISVELVSNYLLAVCVGQCALAMIFDIYPPASAWQMRTFTGEAFMGATDEERLSGIGCALDVAGLRFAAVLVLTAFMAVRAAMSGRQWLLMTYLLSMSVVTIVGNMMSRTTVVGTAVGIAYMAGVVFWGRRASGKRRLVVSFTILAATIVVASTALYNSNENFRENVRFGFEGFFSLVEKGHWETNSNNILKNMVVWPDNVKTWIIGDGYIENPLDKRLASYDPYYIGPEFHGYYMQTDIGYCRYIFYFGIIGLAIFCIYFWKVSNILVNRFPQYKWMFYLVLAINFIGWCKVSSDIFMVFAPFLCISASQERRAAAEEEVSEEQPAVKRLLC